VPVSGQHALPHHLHLARAVGEQVVVIAAAELARQGLLDILSSDYVPGSLLSAVVRLVDEDILPLPQAMALVTLNPARATGMTDRGQISEGLRADLVHVRLNELPDGSRQATVRGVWREGVRVI
jgi:alpha-D-ribose 1-methylphosphonate 5-triphosphate diphosphatase